MGSIMPNYPWCDINIFFYQMLSQFLPTFSAHPRLAGKPKLSAKMTHEKVQRHAKAHTMREVSMNSYLRPIKWVGSRKEIHTSLRVLYWSYLKPEPISQGKPSFSSYSSLSSHPTPSFILISSWSVKSLMVMRS